MKLDKRKRILLGSILIGIIACIMLALFIDWNSLFQKNSANIYDDLADSIETPQATLSPTLEPTLELMPSPSLPGGKRPNDREIDFDALLETNSDVVGWIYVPGTDVDYPLLRAPDNLFYIEHDILKKKNKVGAIFIDTENQPYLEDAHTLIYGHNMKNGSMFASLHRYEEKEFFDANRYVKIYTPEGMLQYEIFAAYEADDRHLMYNIDYNIESVFDEYLTSLKDMQAKGVIGFLQADELRAGDKIITLSTCIAGKDDKRFLVQAVLMKD